MTDKAPALMSVDVEDWFQVENLRGAIARDTWNERELRVERNVGLILDILAASGTKATFFTLGWVAERAPGLVKKIHSGGHEIASHGYGHDLIYNLTEDQFREDVTRSKKLLEDITGAPVMGYRASTYSITKRSLWALDILKEAGFLYDSSIFPIRHDLYGIPDAPQEPSRIKTPKGASIVEFPMSTAPMFGTKLPVSGGGYFRLLPYWLTQAGLRKLNGPLKRPFIFYLHPWEVDPEQPRVRTSFKSRLRHYTNLDRTEARLRRLISEFRFAPVREVLSAQRLLVDSPAGWQVVAQGALA